MKKLSILLLIVILFAGCEKEEYGNAEMLTFDIKVNYSEWEPFSGDRYSGWFITKQIPEITEEIVSSGVVMVYVKYEDYYIAMPYTQAFEDISMTDYFSFTLNKMYIGVKYNYEEVVNGELSTREYRVVIFRSVNSAGINITDYNAVKEYYKLID